jgi:hypothetical protein
MATATSTRTLLLVEDDSTLALERRDTLAFEGFRVLHAEMGEERPNCSFGCLGRLGRRMTFVTALCALHGCAGATEASGNPDGGGGRGPIPTKDGVPIGDCRELSADELAALGCPIEPPQPLSSCDGSIAGCPYELRSCDVPGTECPYEIRVESSMSSQVFYRCSGDAPSWGGGAMLTCGIVCAAPEAHITEFSPSCGNRTVSSCASGSDILSTAQNKLDIAFASLLSDCGYPVSPVSPGTLFDRVQLELTDGCPTRLSSISPLDSAVLQCLTARLDSLRWDCALNLTCTAFARPMYI